MHKNITITNSSTQVDKITRGRGGGGLVPPRPEI